MPLNNHQSHKEKKTTSNVIVMTDLIHINSHTHIHIKNEKDAKTATSVTFLYSDHSHFGLNNKKKGFQHTTTNYSADNLLI